MPNPSSVTVINDKNLRGIVGPTSSISRKVLEDMIDLIGHAHPEVVFDINNRFKRAKKNVDGRKLRASLGAL